jgi:NADPH:quinone reductase-like Zn-dependent oxidoreductase
MSKVVRFRKVGGPEVLQFDDVNVALPRAGEVQIRVKALGINRAQVMYRSGQYLVEPKFPASLGYEASGDIVAVGSDVERFTIGDAVSVIPAFSLAESGMYGEIVNAPVHAVVKNPFALSAIVLAPTSFDRRYGRSLSVMIPVQSAAEASLSLRIVGSRERLVQTSSI